MCRIEAVLAGEEPTVGDTAPSTVTGTTHSFDRLSDIRAEVAHARVWGGLHFRKSTEDGDTLGTRTTRFVLALNFHEADDH
jgi:hypothetical protein